MGLFDFLRRKSDPNNKQNLLLTDSYSALPNETESQFYQPKEYYTAKAFEGTQFERTVITFEERKKTCNPSRNGLYVAEILLLAMCSSYPNPKNGYPGYWWFQYGIRNVGNALKSLEQRGFIQFSTATESIHKLTIPQLKNILEKFDLPTVGKKSDLVDRIQDSLTENDLADSIPDRKYTLTELGRRELEENEYVLYMHRHPRKTTEDTTFGPAFNVWEVNKQLAQNPQKYWQHIVAEMEKQTFSNNQI